MKYVIAVSGGVDSVVLLDMAVKKNRKGIVVAHFEHGIRGVNSKADARFVEALSRKYGLTCEIGYGGLGSNASEALARERRYDFLYKVARQNNAQLIVAHHQDDLIETIALNIRRGTGWRGLTPMSDKRVLRPLIGMTKLDIYKYALANSLEWVEDETNQSARYTRNRLRKHMHRLSDLNKIALLHGVSRQRIVRKNIESEVDKILGRSLTRYFITMIDKKTAIELLNALTNYRLTTPQLEALLIKIKTTKDNKEIQPGAGITIKINSSGWLCIDR